MPPPKRRHSSERRDKRRGQDRAQRVAVAACPECGKVIEPHRACPACGTYGKTRNVIPTKKRGESKE